MVVESPSISDWTVSRAWVPACMHGSYTQRPFVNFQATQTPAPGCAEENEERQPSSFLPQPFCPHQGPHTQTHEYQRNATAVAVCVRTPVTFGFCDTDGSVHLNRADSSEPSKPELPRRQPSSACGDRLGLCAGLPHLEPTHTRDQRSTTDAPRKAASLLFTARRTAEGRERTGSRG